MTAPLALVLAPVRGPRAADGGVSPRDRAALRAALTEGADLWVVFDAPAGDDTGPALLWVAGPEGAAQLAASGPQGRSYTHATNAPDETDCALGRDWGARWRAGRP